MAVERHGFNKCHNMLKLQYYNFFAREGRIGRMGSRALMPRHSESDLNMLDDHLLMHMGYNPPPSRPARALRYHAQVCPAFQTHSRTRTHRSGRAPRMGPVSADGGRLQNSQTDNLAASINYTSACSLCATARRAVIKSSGRTNTPGCCNNASRAGEYFHQCVNDASATSKARITAIVTTG